jgi:membrane-bound serine protease (ClpP class)
MSSRKLSIVSLLAAFLWIAVSVISFLYAPSLRGGIDEIVYFSIHEELTDGSTNYIRDAINVANYRGSRLIVVSLDTPGGFVSSVMDMMSLLDQSKIPVVVFVEPFQAVSGGTYVLMASHIAAMKSSTQIGSCQPVSSSGEPITESKYVNYLVGSMRSHAWSHSRNETAAELFVKENLNLHSEEALRFGVIDLIAENLQDLLSKLSKRILIRYSDGEASRFVLVNRESVNQFATMQSWDFANIQEAEVREFRNINPVYLPSFLFQYPFALSFPLLLLVPYVYPIFVVPMLSLTVGFSIEVIIAIIAGVNGIACIGCALVFFLRKKDSRNGRRDQPNAVAYTGKNESNNV